MAQETISDLDSFVSGQLRNFSIPVKTRNLANRLGLDIVELSQCLKRLEKEGIVAYITTKSKRDSNKIGWIIASSKL